MVKILKGQVEITGDEHSSLSYSNDDRTGAFISHVDSALPDLLLLSLRVHEDSCRYRLVHDAEQFPGYNEESHGLKAQLHFKHILLRTHTC